MSQDEHNKGPDPDSKASLETAGMQDERMQDVHAQLMREKNEPEEGFSPVPIFLLFAFAALCFWGGVYLVEYSGDFDKNAFSPYYDPGAFVEPPPPIPLAEVGAKIYRNQCAQCHQATGQGVTGVYPPLVASAWVTGSEERLARILVNGLNGPIVVAGNNYNGNMPAFGPNGLNLKPREIAGVLSYIRQEWGNAAAEISEEAMDGYMDQYGSRSAPWNAEELLADFPME
jgi:mono/diheme cytochrome c family protein